MKTLVVIPARMASSRFPGKPLAKIHGREMILHVCDSLPSYQVVVATPDQVIFDTVKNAGYSAFLTRTECRTGTDRLVEVAQYMPADIYINVQGDEPLIAECDILAIDKLKRQYHNCVIGAVCRIDNDTNDVKCILENGILRGISREVYRQRGIYALNGEELELFGRTEIPDTESIEITRFMHIGLPVRMAVIQDSPDVNVPEDIQRIESFGGYQKGKAVRREINT